jgi:hypothetical protein
MARTQWQTALVVFALILLSPFFYDGVRALGSLP